MKNLNKYKFLPFLLILSILFSSPATAKDTSLLENRQYYKKVHSSLQKSSKSISIAMYFIVLTKDNKSNLVKNLLEDLVKAKRRGVKVKVIIEDSKISNSYKAYQYLHNHSIPVFIDSPTSLLHTKSIVIDKKLTIIGSHNWTNSALKDNQELSLFIDSKKIAQKVTKYIKNIDTTIPENLIPQGKESIPISNAFLLTPDYGPKLLKNNANKGFDLYLYLLSLAYKNKTERIEINYHEIEKLLNYNPPLRKLLYPLKNRYNLIKYKSGSKIITLKKLKPVENNYPEKIYIPKSYWGYDLDKKLSLRAKYLYLISLYEALKSTRNPCWFRSQEDLSKLYHISDYTISLGLQELEKDNILEIKRDISEEEYGDRKANIYCLNPLEVVKEFQLKLNKLKQKYGKTIVQKSIQLSSQLNEPKDIKKIKTYIKLIQEYGFDKVKKANNRTSNFKKGSGLYSIATTIEYLENQ